MARNSFAFSHLEATAPEMAAVSRKFAELAMWIVANLPPSAERTVAVRKVLEAKDAACRSQGGIALPTCTADFDGLFSP